MPAGRYAKVSGFCVYSAGTVSIGGQNFPSGGTLTVISEVAVTSGNTVALSGVTGSVYFGIVEYNNPI